MTALGYNRGSCIRGRRAGERRGSLPWFCLRSVCGLVCACVCALGMVMRTRCRLRRSRRRRSRPSCSCFLGITSFFLVGRLPCPLVLPGVVSRLLGVAAHEAAVGLAWALGLLACSCVHLLPAKQQCHAALLRVLQMHRHLVPRLVFGLRLAYDLLCYPAGSKPRSNRCDDRFLETRTP